MQTKLVNKIISDTKADITVEFLTADEIAFHELATLLTQAGFKGKEDQICFLHEKAILVCGLEDKSADNLRAAATLAVRTLKNTNYKSAKTDIKTQESFKALIEGFVLGEYVFDDYKTESTTSTFKTISLSVGELDHKELKNIFEETLIIAKATCFTRDLVNTAPQELNPKILAEVAEKLAKENGLTCNVLDEKGLKKEKMNAMLAVGRASIHESHLIHLAYKPKNPRKVISLVGKGLTYDSGGLSLKPATSMVSMKMDKAGACAVLGILKAASELKLDVEIHGFIGAVENMIGGNAYKPDDILVSRNGTTIEVRNTDAEGRLVLADVLDYAQEKVDADYIFDFATLTGACMIALGQYTTGIMGHSQILFHNFYDAANSSGELVGSLPFNKHLKKLLKSEIADISNTASKPYGGAITAGLFLDKFIKDENKEKWMHFDIAGSAYSESAWDCNSYGATGAGVRLMSNFLKEI